MRGFADGVGLDTPRCGIEISIRFRNTGKATRMIEASVNAN